MHTCMILLEIGLRLYLIIRLRLLPLERGFEGFAKESGHSQSQELVNESSHRRVKTTYLHWHLDNLLRML